MDVEAEFAHARTLAAMGHTDEAWAAVDAILAHAPEHLGTLLLKASLFTDERSWEAGLAVLERAARLWPRSAEALNTLARCLHAMGRDEEALARAEEARGLLGEGDNFVQTAAVYLTLVWCLREMRRYREAVALAEEGLHRMPDAILAQWATQLEDELVEAEKDRC